MTGSRSFFPSETLSTQSSELSGSMMFPLPFTTEVDPILHREESPSS